MNASIDVLAAERATQGFAAVIALRGEHDLGTSERLRAALASVQGRILVDLTACTFVDATIVGVLATGARRCEEAGSRLELLLPRENAPAARILELVHIRDLVLVWDPTLYSEGHR